MDEQTSKNKKSLLVLLTVLLIVLICVVAVISVLILKKRTADDSERGSRDRTHTGDDGKEAQSEEKADTGGIVSERGLLCRVSITVVGANEVGGLEGASVLLLDADGETIAAAETDSAGNAEFTEVTVGDYSVVCEAEGYNRRETDLAVTGAEDGGNAVTQTIALAPRIVGDDACVLLVWAGDHDLDLCAFHSELKEYVNIGHPVDSAGNIILYADHGADAPYELLYIHDISDAVAKSIYVTEAAKARAGEASYMEADGVWIFVYDASGLVFFAKADSGEEAALWRPCYYYMSNVYEEQEYISATRDEAYAWLSFEEVDAYAGDVADPENEEMLSAEHSGRSIVLTEEDKSLLRVVANEGLGGMYGDTQTTLLMQPQLQDKIKARMDDFVWDIASSCSDEGTRGYGTDGWGTLTTYDAALVEMKINELFHSNISIGEYLPSAESALLPENDSGYGGCYCRNGKLYTLKWGGGENGVAASYLQQKYENDLLVLVYGWSDAYGDYDVETGASVYRGYTSIYLWEADNALGYEIGAIRYEPAMTEEASSEVQVAQNDWKQAYLDTLSEIRRTAWPGVNDAHMDIWIIELDNDGIPDLYVEPWLDEQQILAAGAPQGHDQFLLLSYQNGSVYEYAEYGSGGFYMGYLPTQGICVTYMAWGEMSRCERITAHGFEGYNGAVNENQCVIAGPYGGELAGNKMTYEEAVAYLHR